MNEEFNKKVIPGLQVGDRDLREDTHSGVLLHYELPPLNDILIRKVI